MASASCWRSLSSFCVASAELPTCHIACSTLHTLHSTLHPLHFTLHTLHSTLYTPHSTLYTLHSTLYTPRFILDTLHTTLYTLHFILYTPHFTLYKRCTSNSILFTPHWPFFHVYDVSLSTRFGIRTIIEHSGSWAASCFQTYYGGFHKWGYPQMDGWLHGKSKNPNLKWMRPVGTPISGTLHILTKSLNHTQCCVAGSPPFLLDGGNGPSRCRNLARLTQKR